jgi:hypothetical protein
VCGTASVVSPRATDLRRVVSSPAVCTQRAEPVCSITWALNSPWPRMGSKMSIGRLISMASRHVMPPAFWIRQSAAAIRTGISSLHPITHTFSSDANRSSRRALSPAFVPVTTTVCAPDSAAHLAARSRSPMPQAPPTTRATNAFCSSPRIARALLRVGAEWKPSGTGRRARETLPPARLASSAECRETTKCRSTPGSTQRG